MKKEPALLRSVLKSPSLNALWQQAERQRQLNETIRSHLPEALRKHLIGSRLDQACLTLSWSSSAAASTARFQAPVLSSALGDSLEEEPRSIAMRVRPEPAERSLKITPQTIPSLRALSHLERTALHCPDDEIRRSLERLCQTLKNKTAPGVSS